MHIKATVQYSDEPLEINIEDSSGEMYLSREYASPNDKIKLFTDELRDIIQLARMCGWELD